SVLLSLSSLSVTFPLPDLHSFPTRRSSDLTDTIFIHITVVTALRTFIFICGQSRCPVFLAFPVFTLGLIIDRTVLAVRFKIILRSEEHTSELQSRFDLVCRLLLATKNIIDT